MEIQIRRKRGENEDEDGLEEKYSVYLQNWGDNFTRKGLEKHPSGLQFVIYNYPTGGKLWKFRAVKSKNKSSLFAAVDERGQIFAFDIASDHYHIVRSAGASINSFSFVNTRFGRKKDIIISYNSGLNIIVDSTTKEILGNIKKKLVSRSILIRNNPSKDEFVMVNDIGEISVWNTNNLNCIGNLEFNENILDIQYELDGKIVVVVTENSGIYWYQTSSYELIAKFRLSEYERHPNWTSYCTSLVSEGEKAGDKLLAVFLAGDNGLLYQWLANISVDEDGSLNVENRLMSVIELPVKVPRAIQMESLSMTAPGSTGKGVRIVLLSSEGSLMLVQGDEIYWNSFGSWRIIADIPSSLVQGSYNRLASDLMKLFHVEPISLALSPSTSSSMSTSFEIDNHKPLTRYFRLNCLAVENPYIMVVGADGGIRVFDQVHMVGYGEICDTYLRSRRPFYKPGQSLDFTDPMPQKVSEDRKRGKSKSMALHSDSSKEASPKKGSRGKGSTSTSTVTKNDKKSISKGADDRNLSKSAQKSGSESQKNNKERSFSTSTTNEKPAASSSEKFILNMNVPPELAKLNVFELSQLVHKDRQVNIRKLKSFLSTHGEFPSKYRSLIWRFLLRLPENSQSFEDLVHRGVHKAYQELYEKYPIKSRRVFERLQNLCSQIAHWSVIFGEIDYLPSFVFPFVIVYGEDELSMLETSLSLLLYWGYSWNVTYPNPPLHLMDAMDQIVQFHLPKLHFHLHKIKALPGFLIWNFLKTLYSEIFSRSDWLKIMDFLFVHIDRADYFHMVAVVILSVLQKPLLATSTQEQVFSYVRSQQSFVCTEVQSLVVTMTHNTPEKYMNLFLAMKPISLTENNHGQGAISGGVEDESDEAKSNMAQLEGKPIFPLPKGRYPAFYGYPRSLVDWQLRDRERVLAMEQEVRRKNHVLDDLRRQMNRLESDHEQYMLRHRHATEAQEKHHRQMMETEQNYLRELQMIEEEISQQRLKALETLDRTSKEEAELMDHLVESTQHLMEEQQQHWKSKMQATLELQQLREVGETAAWTAQERIDQQRLRRGREEVLRNMTESMQAKEQEWVLQDQLQQEKWRHQDEGLRQQRQKRQAQSQERIEQESFRRLTEAQQHRGQQLAMEREMKHLEIERLRALRLTEEAAEEAAESAERARIWLAQKELRETEEQAQNIAQQRAAASKNRLMESIQAIQEESKRVVEAEAVLLAKEEQERQVKRAKELENLWNSMEEQQLKHMIYTENELQKKWLEVQKQSLLQKFPHTKAAEAATFHNQNMDSNVKKFGNEAFLETKKADRDGKEGIDLEGLRETIVAERRDLLHQTRRELHPSSDQMIPKEASQSSHRSRSSSSSTSLSTTSSLGSSKELNIIRSHVSSSTNSVGDSSDTRSDSSSDEDEDGDSIGDSIGDKEKRLDDLLARRHNSNKKSTQRPLATYHQLQDRKTNEDRVKRENRVKSVEKELKRNASTKSNSPTSSIHSHDSSSSALWNLNQSD